MTNHVAKTNVLHALKNILDSGVSDMPDVTDHVSNNRINSVGDLLEYYVKDAFCGDSASYTTSYEKLKEYQKYFSYLGNASNPPDFVIQHGPAVEVKKIQGVNANGLALNSSFPKDKLYQDDVRIKQECRDCENEFGGWTEKDMIYSVGNVKDNKLQSLWFVYGDCYCADKSYYERIADTIKDGVSSIPDVDFGETKELGRVNKVDPLGITYLRIRGMWGIAHPTAVFRPYIEEDAENTSIYVLMTKKSHDELTNRPDLSEFISDNTLKFEEIEIPDPNNPAKNLAAVLYTGII